MLLDELARTSAAVAETSARGAKIELLASCLRRLTPEEVVPAVTYLSGALRRIGVGWASLAYMTLIQFCLCYVCWFAALARLPAATASIGSLLVPVVGVLASAAMLHEPLGPREIGALVITLGGVGMALRA